VSSFHTTSKNIIPLITVAIKYEPKYGFVFGVEMENKNKQNALKYI
jgi:hypothetical protein